MRASKLTPLRQLTYRLLNLPYHRCLKAAQALNLIEDQDCRVGHVELCKRILARAHGQELLGQLWDEVARLDGEPGKNPFSS